MGGGNSNPMSDYVYFISPNGELYHHGVKGMKWGVRRYQNPDGSLTKEGRLRQNKRLSTNKEAVLSKGHQLKRVSSSNDSDAKSGSKLYVNVDDKEHQVYRQSIGSRNIINNGKAYVQKYVATTDIKVPSVRTQTKIERSLIKDKNVQKEMVESLMAKGYTRENATKMAKPINQGMEWLKASPLLLLTPIAPTAGLAAAAIATEKRKDQLDLIRNSIGDVNNKEMNKAFERKLTDRGYNAYRDTNDRRALRTNKSVVIINPDKNTKLVDSHEMTKSEFGRAYMESKKFYNKRISKDVDDLDLIRDGEKRYDELKDQHIVNEHQKKERERILKEYKDKE